MISILLASVACALPHPATPILTTATDPAGFLAMTTWVNAQSLGDWKPPTQAQLAAAVAAARRSHVTPRTALFKAVRCY